MKSSVEKFFDASIDGLKSDLGTSNMYMLPKITKIAVSCGGSACIRDSNMMESLHKSITSITCQKVQPVVCKISEARFSIRKGMPYGYVVHLRRSNMYNFLTKCLIVWLRSSNFDGLKCNIKECKAGRLYQLNFSIDHYSFADVTDITNKAIPIHANIEIRATSAYSAQLLVEKYLRIPFHQNKSILYNTEKSS